MNLLANISPIVARSLIQEPRTDILVDAAVSMFNDIASYGVISQAAMMGSLIDTPHRESLLYELIISNINQSSLSNETASMLIEELSQILPHEKEHGIDIRPYLDILAPFAHVATADITLSTQKVIYSMVTMLGARILLITANDRVKDPNKLLVSLLSIPASFLTLKLQLIKSMDNDPLQAEYTAACLVSIFRNIRKAAPDIGTEKFQSDMFLIANSLVDLLYIEEKIEKDKPKLAPILVLDYIRAMLE